MNVIDKNLSTNELYEKLVLLITTKTNELKKEISGLQDKKLTELENKLTLIERNQKKNNIVIFGLAVDEKRSIVWQILHFLREKLQVDLTESDINNVYKIGKKHTVIVEFISYLKKQAIYKNVRKLKGTNISITDDLCPSDQKSRKILYEHLKEAKRRNQTAYIQNYKLYINGDAYSAEQLQDNIAHDIDSEFEIELSSKPNSAPPTPNSYRSQQDEIFINEGINNIPNLTTKSQKDTSTANVNNSYQVSVKEKNNTRTTNSTTNSNNTSNTQKDALSETPKTNFQKNFNEKKDVGLNEGRKLRKGSIKK